MGFWNVPVDSTIRVGVRVRVRVRVNEMNNRERDELRGKKRGGCWPATDTAWGLQI